MQSLNETMSDLPEDMPRPDLAAQLQSRLVSVSEATNARRRIDTMAGANRIVQIVADVMSAKQAADFIAPVTAELAAAERLERLFIS